MNCSHLVVLVGRRRLLLADALDVGARRAEERPRRLEGREQTRLFHDRARRLSQRGPEKFGVVGRVEWEVVARGTKRCTVLYRLCRNIAVQFESKSLFW